MKRFCQGILVIALVLCAMFAAETFAATGTVQAASEYKRLFGDGYKAGDVVKSGNYYFYCDSENYQVYMSTKKNTGFKVTNMPYNTFSNGKQAYYIDIGDNALYQFTFSSKKEKRLKKLSSKGYPAWDISTIYGGKIYITKGSFDEWSYHTYAYKISSGSFKRIKKNCCIINRSGKYVIAEKEYRSDVSPYTVTLYKITNDGLKKIKTLTKSGFGARKVGKKWYYVSYPDVTEMGVSMNRAVIYKCNLDGTGKAKVAELTSEVKYDQIIVQEITSKYCIYWSDSKIYKYTYDTQKRERLQ